MSALRKFIKVKNHKIALDVNDDFLEDEEVEVIVLAKKNVSIDLSFLEQEIDKGLQSGRSPNNHEKIIEKLRQKYA